MDNENKNIEYIKAISVIDEYVFNDICKILEENKIPYFVEDEGELMKLVSGFDFFQSNIYVANNRTDDTVELINYILKDGSYNEFIDIFI